MTSVECHYSLVISVEIESCFNMINLCFAVPPWIVVAVVGVLSGDSPFGKESLFNTK